MVRKVLMASVLTVLALALVPAALAGSGNGKGNGLPSPAQIADPSNWTVTTTIGEVREITPQEALAAGAQPGAQTAVADGLTARQAVGLDPIPQGLVGRLGLQTGVMIAATASPSGPYECWNSTVSRKWSIWPMQTTLYDSASWCGYYNGSITYRSHTPHENGTYCEPAGTWSYTSYWYDGSPIWQVADGGYWSCLGGFNESHSMTVDISSSGAHWIE